MQISFHQREKRQSRRHGIGIDRLFETEGAQEVHSVRRNIDHLV